MRSRAVLACAIVVLWPATAWAANVPRSSLTPSILPLIAVGLIAALAAFWLKRHRVPTMTRMRVIARLPLEPRRSIVVVQIGSRAILLGSSEAGLQALGDLAPEELESLTAQSVSRETSEAL